VDRSRSDSLILWLHNELASRPLAAFAAGAISGSSTYVGHHMRGGGTSC